MAAQLTSGTPLEELFDRLQIFAVAESRGGVESLVEAPYVMSHSSMGEAGLKESGITPETVSFSLRYVTMRFV